MKKRRQQDFQKVKLKVGKHLPKGRNITNTSFKTKKIVTRDQLRTSGEISLKELLNHLKGRSASAVKETLSKLNNYILQNQNTLPLYFSDVLQTVGDIIFQTDSKATTSAIEVLKTCLRSLSTLQLKPFIPFLSIYLKCMSSSASHSIRQDSLILLDELLTTHPNAVCQFTKVLNYLLNMISSVVQGSNTMKGTRKKMLSNMIGSSQTSTDWIMAVLQRVHALLQHMLMYRIHLESNKEDDREVYWDGKTPLYLPLYIKGGPNPARLEYPLHSPTSSESMDSPELKRFIQDVAPLLSETLKGEISYSSNLNPADGNLFSQSVIEYVNIVSQVLYCIGEWTQQSSDYTEDADAEFFNEVRSIICNQLMRGFPYAPHVTNVKEKGQKKENDFQCMQLNLAVCYLYSAFILETKVASHKMEEKVFFYLLDVFRVCKKMSVKSVSIILKTCRNFLQSKNTNISFKNGILLGVYGMLDVHKLSESGKLIYDFLMDISMNFEFKYLLNSEGLATWLKLLIKELNFMVESKVVNKKFLKYVKQVCSRRYSHFMETLNSVEPAKMIELLKYDDEEFQMTIAHLIISLDNISSDFLQDIAEAIRQESFSLKTATRLIRLLNVRFSRPNVTEIDKIHFVKFLLNLGCDSFSIVDPTEEIETISFIDTLAEVQDGLHFQLYPSRTFERHFKIFEVCTECLLALPESETMQRTVLLFMQYLLDNSKFLAHNAIALLELRNKLDYIYQDEQLPSLFYELVFSCLMYISVVSNEVPEENYHLYAVQELQNSLNLINHDAVAMTDILQHSVFDYTENQVYHSLRMFMFLIRKELFGMCERDTVYQLLDKMSTICQQSTVLEEIWMSICKVCGFL